MSPADIRNQLDRRG